MHLFIYINQLITVSVISLTLNSAMPISNTKCKICFENVFEIDWIETLPTHSYTRLYHIGLIGYDNIIIKIVLTKLM